MRFLSVVLFFTFTSLAGAEDSEALVAVARYSQVETFDDLDQLAKQTASSDFVPRRAVPESLAAMVYDQYVKIQYKIENATWWGTDRPFWIETFHQGFVQRDRVWLFVREDDRNRLIPFSTDDFTYDLHGLDPKSIADAGHAGIKIAGRFPRGAEEEFLTFLGSSYFRARSESNVYGASARGLAIDIATEGAEEFPFYRAIWIDEPTPDAKSVTVRALLDSPTVCGAYQFELMPGATTTSIDVRSSLHFRRVPKKLAIAPLTSMWIWGDGLRGPPKDARPSVHDSDGLLIRTGEAAHSDWTWRAIARPPYPSVTSFPTDRLLGFGLMQRNTSFFHFDDHNALYNKRPSVFVTPHGDWGAGRIELLELPGAHEGIDNLGAYWIPQLPPTTDAPLRLRYTVEFFGGDHGGQSNVARATSLELKRGAESIALTVRFAGEVIREIPATAYIDVAIATVRGAISEQKLTKTQTGDWLLKMVATPSEPAPMEIKATLRHRGQPVSETFSYLCPHDEPQFVYPDVYTR
ncbi:Glucans biosynthesis protein G precursor [Rubripirellula tenax]|uniref:Glucans biosynthesis protein G n=1 Tax=Rubripirellula tenax TaxID=2528015 RepID=A0A5C6FJC9_9BACT|nr:glucan biosynthesis protein [Rubripirellula tenax]TWU60693.1 Glucans biosynthesis protein G precursor [Rubripirellula tenax]